MRKARQNVKGEKIPDNFPYAQRIFGIRRSVSVFIGMYSGFSFPICGWKQNSFIRDNVMN
ncbi:CLUMA_CG000424, isoform A [Clunio marinus]|uniref:CLUMA_CG000424, isoform A n=1 Tax=Clunio marinus TaxID=568069 RepID=A0A1J1HEX9_9DIPT|nr:CLUMA_CG000424, isoform A [Clunio marinus]